MKKDEKEKFEPIFVNCVLFSEDFEKIVFLHKTTGPKFLLGKNNFVGGKQEKGEDTLTSVLREIKEEAGIDVPENCLYSINYKEFEKDGKKYKLENFTGVVPLNILAHAHTAEHEEVFFMNTRDVILDVLSNPNDYTDDFKSLIKLSLDKTPELLDNKNRENVKDFIISREAKFSKIKSLYDTARANIEARQLKEEQAILRKRAGL